MTLNDDVLVIIILKTERKYKTYELYSTSIFFFYLVKLLCLPKYSSFHTDSLAIPPIS